MTSTMTMDAMAQASAVRAGHTDARGLVEDAIAAIEDLDPLLNAVIHRLFDRARERADALHTAGPAARGDPGAPAFAGVPVLFKDLLCQTDGDPYHAGMMLLKNHHWRARTDAFLATRFRQAGFIDVGRTNVPELASSFTTEPLSYGATRNPWDLMHTAGGSSGGSAAAVASGMVAIAHGNDMGGSVRVPASMCGILGVKPSHGSISLGPEFGDLWAMLAHQGILARTVDDAAAALDAVAGPVPGDPDPTFLKPLLHAAHHDPGTLRVGVRTRVPLGGEAQSACVGAVRRAAGILADLGHGVCEVPMPALDDTGLAEPFLDIFAVSVDRDLRRWEERLGIHIGEHDIEARNWSLSQHARHVSATRYVASIEYLQAYARRIAEQFTSIDVLLTPTLPETVPLLGLLGPSPTLEQTAHLGEFTAPFNITGQPAASVPITVSDDGLPSGVQLVTAQGRDDLLVSVAAQLEQQVGWPDRHPPVSVWTASADRPELPGVNHQSP